MENPEVNVVEKAPVRKKSGSRIWIFVLGFCCCVLVGVGVGVVVKYMRDNAVYFPSEEWWDVADRCIYKTSDGDECSDFRTFLSKIIDRTDDEDEKVMAVTVLASVDGADDVGSAIAILEANFDDDLSDQNKYAVLSMLMSFYKIDGRGDKYVWSLREIVSLPDSMKLEFEDWSKVKPLLELELKSLEEEDEKIGD